MTASTPAQLPHVVVLGAGFGGLAFAQHFPSHVARVTVVDRQNHHLFQPLLYQVATAGLAAPDIAQPIRHILRDKPNLVVQLGSVQRVDLAARRVELDTGALDFDWLVIALGSRTTYFGHDEWEQFAPGLKTLDDATTLRRRMLLAYERAEVERDPQRRAELMTTIVVGGGPTGVELAGTFAELARTVLYRDFDHIDARQARVLLVEGGPRVLATFPEDLSASAHRQLTKLGVEVRVNTIVKNISEGEVQLGAEVMRAGNIVWAAGVGAVPITKTLGVETDRAGRVKVLPDFSVPGQPRVFAIGDLASLVDANGVLVPGVAQGAMQAGQHVAREIAYDITTRERPPQERAAFRYRDKGNMATIGRSKAVAQIGQAHLRGFPAWAAWLAIHLVFLIGFRNRLSVFLQWVYAYFFHQRGARIITGLKFTTPPAPPPAASSPVS